MFISSVARVLESGEGKNITQLSRGYHAAEIVHLDEWWGKQVSLDFIFFERAEMEAYLRIAGFEIEDILERPPYPEGVEAQTRRVYIFARKPS